MNMKASVVSLELIKHALKNTESNYITQLY